MLNTWRTIARFFADCMDALRDEDDVRVERFKARQERWLDYLRS